MSDCLNVEIRELLPDYLSGTLTASRRAEVDAHVASCAECADELAVLRLVREAYVESPAVNVKAIVAALPRKSVKPAMRTIQAGAPVGRSWRHSHAFQIAAAVSFITLGGISLAVARSFFNGNPSAVTRDTVVAVGAETPISFAGGVSDLGDEDLEALLSALENIEALPVTETADPPLTGTGRQGS